MCVCLYSDDVLLMLSFSVKWCKNIAAEQLPTRCRIDHQTVPVPVSFLNNTNIPSVTTLIIWVIGTCSRIKSQILSQGTALALNRDESVWIL